jgi:hypothetical protein
VAEFNNFYNNVVGYHSIAILREQSRKEIKYFSRRFNAKSRFLFQNGNQGGSFTL